MTFEIGQTVVYPHHGAAVIENITTRKLKGEDTTYLMLRVTNGDMTIQVPAANVDMVGVRDVVDEEGLKEVLAVLQEPHIEEPTNWSRRYKVNGENRHRRHFKSFRSGAGSNFPRQRTGTVCRGKTDARQSESHPGF